MVVKVYGSSRAVSPQRVMLCLLEKGVEFEVVHVDLDAMQHKTPEYLINQPFGKVPYIEDGDFKLYVTWVPKVPLLPRFRARSGCAPGYPGISRLPRESRAIIRYYAAKYEKQGPQLLGKTPEERALVDQWLDVEAMTFDPLVFPIVFNLIILPRLGLPADASAVHSSAEKLDKVLDVYEQRLSKSKYLAGSEFTLADLAHIPATRRLEDAGFACMFANRKHLNAWWEDISSRPSLKKLVNMGA
ncbi:hypothetical protein Taro_041332 [Colocasia esculenta]|uniref:glutathione transferase n=1 Tax=Colocasia esculenta TaxID=4460 RepID=A0A843WVJ6_COLES|nr:hypothetical protein [Colocasia esculenta]